MEPTRKDIPETLYRASRICRILGNPTAYVILKLMGTGKKRPSDIAEELQVSPAIVSATLRHLMNLELVRYETNGHFREYSLKDRKTIDLLDSIEKWIEALRSRKA